MDVAQAITELGSVTADQESLEYEIALRKFQQFVSKSFKDRKGAFLDELFKTLKYESNQVTVLRCLSALRAVDLGDVVSKANRIGRELMESRDQEAPRQVIKIKPEPDRQRWKLLFEVLMWLHRVNRSSTHIIFDSLKDVAWRCVDRECGSNSDALPAEAEREVDKRQIAGFQMMEMFISHMPLMIATQCPRMLEAIYDAVKRKTRSVCDGALDLLKLAVTRREALDLEMEYVVKRFLEKGIVYVGADEADGMASEESLDDWRSLDNVLRAVKLILEMEPELNRRIQCKSVPPPVLEDTKDENIQRGLLQYLPFACQMNPAIFSAKAEEHVRDKKKKDTGALCKVITWYKDRIVKRTPFQRDATKSLADFIFNLKTGDCSLADAGEPLRAIQKHVKSLARNLADDNIVCLQLALIYCQDDWDKEKSDKKRKETRDKMFSDLQLQERELSKELIDGLSMFAQRVPEKEHEFSELVLKKIRVVLLSDDPNRASATIQVAYQALSSVLFSGIGSLSLPAAIQFSKALRHSDINVRRVAAEFATRYQQETGSLELTGLICSAVCTETNSELRHQMLNGIGIALPSPIIVDYFHTLLDDRDPAIEKRVLEMIAAKAGCKEWSELLSQYITERIPTGSTAAPITKRTISGFATIALNMSSTKQLLLPFSKFLISYLISAQRLPTDGLRLLALILKLKPEAADVTRLAVVHISSALTTHSSQRRIAATLDLLLNALAETDLRFSIYDEHVHIITRLLELLKVSDLETVHPKIARTLSTVGALAPSWVKEKLEQTLTPTKQARTISVATFLRHNENDDLELKNEAMKFAAVDVVVSYMLTTIMDPDMAMLHPNLVEQLLPVLAKNRDYVSRELKDIVLKDITYLITHGSPAIWAELLQKHTTLIVVLGDSFAPLLPHVVEFIKENWETGNKQRKKDLVSLTITLLQRVREFTPYLVSVLHVFLEDFHGCEDDIVDSLFDVFGQCSECGIFHSVDHFVMPILLDWIMYNSRRGEVVTKRLNDLEKILEKSGSAKWESQIINSVLMIAPMNTEIHPCLLNILAVVARDVGKRFLLHKPAIEAVLDINSSEALLKALSQVNSGQRSELQAFRRPISQTMSKGHQSMHRSGKMGEFEIPRPAWDEVQWFTWASTFFARLMNKSSSRAVQLATDFVERLPGLKECLYPAALVLTYIDDKQNESGITIVFENVLTFDNVPTTILKHFLNAIELLEILGNNDPNKNWTRMAHVAEKAGYLAQALRYYEVLFKQDQKNGTEALPENLVRINKDLGLMEAAYGILRYTKTENERMTEQLGLWEEALKHYTVKLRANPTDPVLKQSELRCLRSLLRFEEMHTAAAPMTISRAVACWNTFNLDEFNTICESSAVWKSLKVTDPDMIYKVWWYISNGQIRTAKADLERLWDPATESLFPMICEDYERAFPQLASVSLLALTDEVIGYKESQRNLDSAIPMERERAKLHLEQLRRLWTIKFNKLPEDTRILFSVMRLLSTVVPENEMPQNWGRLLNIAIQQKYTSLASLLIRHLRAKDMDAEFQEQLNLFECKVRWKRGEKNEAIQDIIELIPRIQHPATVQMARYCASDWLEKEERVNESYECMRKLMDEAPEPLNYWSLWTHVTFALYESTKEEKYLLESFHATIVGMLKDPNPMGLTLRIISNLFRRGNKEMYNIFQSKVDSIPVHIWLEVLPQIMARLSTSDADLLSILHNLITSVGNAHPHPVLCSLLVLFKSDNEELSSAARNFMNHFSKNHPSIVEQTILLGDELIRTAATWWEIAFASIVEAQFAYYELKSPEKMISALAPLHEITLREPESFSEASFSAMFGNTLKLADALVDRYKTTKDPVSIHQAWAYYDTIYSVSKDVHQSMDTISLFDASPNLDAMKDAAIAVPGTYTCGQPLVTISSFKPILKIKRSKQRPRKMSIIGSDGNRYTFLLKGNATKDEDIRRDERAMQLFGYINTLISQSDITLKNRLSIITYKVIPFTSTVGLIGWVHNCVVLDDIIKEHRQGSMNREDTLRGNYDELPAEQRKALFEKLIDPSLSDGADVKRYLISHASDSSNWLDRRTTYTATLAMTSICGYVLGLGDRHVRNIMLERKTAKLVHIDFGDCFEVLMHRAEFPEKVPFRLTRILVEALEVAGIDGTFRDCCEDVMDIVRKNDANILELFEAFIYDPLIQWTSEAADGEQQSPVAVVARIRDKLNGCDFPGRQNLSVSEQVNELIQQATDPNNLCCMYSGWRPWW